MEKDEKILNYLVEYLNEKYSHIYLGKQQWNLNIGNCYTTSKLASEILNGVGYECEPRRVSMIIGNDIGKQIFIEQAKKKKFDKHEIMERGGYVIGLGIPQPNSPEDSHWVVWCPRKKAIMDLTIGQASRPQHGINLRPFFGTKENFPKEIIEMYFIQSEKPRNLYMEKEPLKSYSEAIVKEGIFTLREVRE